ncbi:MAG: 16S rRNA (guanine(527)-N(7))-methyltransferase RsmG [Gammaproteobacteria bacterium]
MAVIDVELKTLLTTGSQQLAIEINVDQEALYWRYLQLLQKWNHSYNLTAITTLPEMLVKHVLDSLAVVPYLYGDSVLDVGTGAGVPGIILSIYFPTKQFTLMDSNGKKTRFLTHVIQQLNLRNVEIVQQRVERYTSNHRFTSIVSRAFSSLAEFVILSQHLLTEDGCFVAMKGQVPHDEILQLGKPWHSTIHSVQVPFLHQQRSIIIVRGAVLS